MADLSPEKQHPLSQFVIAVLVVWVVILAGVWVFDRERFATFAHVCGGSARHVRDVYRDASLSLK